MQSCYNYEQNHHATVCIIFECYMYLQYPIDRLNHHQEHQYNTNNGMRMSWLQTSTSTEYNDKGWNSNNNC